MKNLIKFLLAFVIVGALFSCEKNVSMITVQGATPPVLSSNKDSLILNYATKDQEAIKLSWTNPDYKFSTGVSSQNVSYRVEIDTAGANFTNPNKKTVTVSQDLSVSFTQTDFNDFLLNQLNLKAGVKHNIEIRLIASLTNNALPLTSKVLKYTVTPYAIPPKVAVPASGKLYITGGATPASWMNGGDAELTTQKFTQMSSTLYVLPSIKLTGGGSYLFVPTYGDWGAKYGGIGSNNGNNVDGDDFKFNGADILAPATTGNYKIEVDFQRGKFTVTKL